MIDPVALLKTYHAALNDFDLDKAESLFAEDAVYVSSGLSGEIKGRSAIMQAMRKYFTEYADQISTDESIEQLDHLSVKSNWSLSATSRSTRARTTRQGEEIIYLNIKGLIKRIEVKDHH